MYVNIIMIVLHVYMPPYIQETRVPPILFFPCEHKQLLLIYIGYMIVVFFCTCVYLLTAVNS